MSDQEEDEMLSDDGPEEELQVNITIISSMQIT